LARSCPVGSSSRKSSLYLMFLRRVGRPHRRGPAV
jgi:hypothetical protein